MEGFAMHMSQTSWLLNSAIGKAVQWLQISNILLKLMEVVQKQFFPETMEAIRRIASSGKKKKKSFQMDRRPK